MFEKRIVEKTKANETKEYFIQVNYPIWGWKDKHQLLRKYIENPRQSSIFKMIKKGWKHSPIFTSDLEECKALLNGNSVKYKGYRIFIEYIYYEYKDKEDELHISYYMPFINSGYQYKHSFLAAQVNVDGFINDNNHKRWVKEKSKKANEIVEEKIIKV